MKYTRRALGALILASVMLTTACAGGNSSSGREGSSGAVGDPVQGGAARVMTISEPRTLDPLIFNNTQVGDGLLGNALFGTLFTSDPSTGTIEPSIAQGLTTDDEGETFSLTLRDGLTFSDGTPLDAAAVKFTFDRLKDPATAAINFPFAALVSSSDVVDATTLKLTMTEPIPNFGQMITNSALNWVPSPKALSEGSQKFDANPVGAGPFTLKSWTRGDVIELVKNPGYWDAPKPYLDSLTLKSTGDSLQRVNTLIAGGAEVAIDNNSSSTLKAQDEGYPTVIQPLSGGNTVVFNTSKAPFDDPKARLAIAKAIDLDAMNTSITNGAAVVPNSLFTESSPFYTDTKLTGYDKAGAQSLFDEIAAAGSPLDFTMILFPTTESRSRGEFIQAQLSEYSNANVEIEVLDYAAALASLGTGDFQAITGGTMFVDPEPHLTSQLMGDSGPGNWARIDDPEMNEALEIGRSASDLEQRRSAYDTVQRRLADLNPMILVSRPTVSVITAKNVGGVTLYGLGSLLPAELWIGK